MIEKKKITEHQKIYSFPTSKMDSLSNVFDNAQNNVYQLLKTNYFPTFLAHKLCNDGLLNRLKIEERFFDALKRSHMI